ncbi:MAG: thiolase family protein [Elusimicrobiota bacterium]|nr:thiolase family protein [Elusimicrobiota bacterium]
MTDKREVVILDAVRSPIGRLGGVLSGIRPDDLAARLIEALCKRNSLDPGEISDVYLGCANQAGEDNRNIARMAVLLAGLPFEIPACTVNRLCGSGLEAVNLAAKSILAGEGDLYLAGGVESMSRAPWVIGKPGVPFQHGNMTAYDTSLGWRFPNSELEKRIPLLSMGETAENLAERYKIGREEQDSYAFESHRKAVRARDSFFSDEIIPVSIPAKKGPPVILDKDEPPRADTSLEKLAALPAAFRKGGTVTGGNSSGLNDGAAFLVLASREKAEALGKKPMARWLGSATAGLDPSCMGLGPVFSTRKLLQRLGLTLAELDLIELNEAFAAQVLSCVRELDIPMDKLNPNGGAIALGHPLGSSGARILTTLLHEMKRRQARLGLAALCIGVGQGISTIVSGE